jgi:hypothetical protein
MNWDVGTVHFKPLPRNFAGENKEIYKKSYTKINSAALKKIFQIHFVSVSLVYNRPVSSEEIKFEFTAILNMSVRKLENFICF